MCIRDRHQHGAAQGGGLLLQTAGVGHHQIAPGHQVVHLVHGQGGEEVDAGVVVQILMGGLLNHGGEVYGVDQLHLCLLYTSSTPDLAALQRAVLVATSMTR